MANRNKDEQQAAAENLAYFEDVLVETKSKRADWLSGLHEIAGYLCMSTGHCSTALTSGVIKGARQVKGDAKSYSYKWIILRADAEKYKVSRETPAVPASTATNGHSKEQEKEVVFLKSGSPIASEKDMDAWIRGMNNLRYAIEQNTAAVKENTIAANQLTQELKPPQSK